MMLAPLGWILHQVLTLEASGWQVPVLNHFLWLLLEGSAEQHPGVHSLLRRSKVCTEDKTRGVRYIQGPI
jgi:hypothetical protein